MSYQIPITQSDLHSYVDGHLNFERRREVQAYLEDNPEAAAMVEDYQLIGRSLHSLYDPVLDEPVPEQLAVMPTNRWQKLLRVAAMVGLFTLGGISGWYLRPPPTPSQADLLSTQLIQPAAFAHAVYSPEVRHPVEVTAAEVQHLTKWLSKRLSTELKVPNLDDKGFELVGGRLLPSTDRMAAQLMYQRQDGRRITLYTRQGVWKNKQTAFQFSEQDGTSILYWIDGPLGFALAGDITRKELLKLSEAVYQQFN